MSSSIHTPQWEPDWNTAYADAQRWFAIDTADGTESLWFYWPMMGTGIAVAVTALVLLGVGGLFGIDWERRQVERYIQQHRGRR